MKYRPEVDGLRTIAVGSVLVYHAEIYVQREQLFAGGYLGVDVFFVISGFLITSLIFAEFQNTGRFSILNFYERRARRLLPALFTVILASLPFAWAILLPTQLVDYAWSIISSVFFVSNFYWDQTLLEYGAESALLKPFVHTWSLAVEEQYYVFAPLFLTLLYKFASRYVLVGLGVLVVASLVLTDLLNDRGSFAFYMLPTRLWELMIGAMLAHVMVYRDRFNAPVWMVSGVMSVSMAVLVACMFLIPFNQNHPGYLTLVPVLATAALIFFAHPQDWVTRLLSSRLFVGIGLISYSLYLWHYPIFAFGRHLDPRPDLMSKAIWIGLTIILSVASYFLIERPFRNRARLNIRPAVGLFAASAVAFTLFSGTLIAGEGFRWRMGDLVALYGDNEFDNQALRSESKRLLQEVARTGFFNDPEKTNVLFVGNSHSRDLWNAYYLNRDAYPDLAFGRYQIQIGDSEELYSELLNSPEMQQADIVVISTRYQRIRRDIRNLSTFMEGIQALGKQLYVTSNNVKFSGSGGGRTLFDRIIERGNTDHERIMRVHYERQDPTTEGINLAVLEVVENAGMELYWKQDIVCLEGESMCYGVTPEGLKTYYDDGHWTMDGAQFFGGLMAERCWLPLGERCAVNGPESLETVQASDQG